MHEYFFRVETVRLGIIVGVIISMLFYERLQLTTGGAIVPGYLAAFLPRPHFILITLLSAYLTYYTVNHVISKKYILYGRRKFEVEILVGLGFVTLWLGISAVAVRWTPELAALYGIGFVIPAIIAHDMNRQKPKKTILAVLVTTVLVGLIIFIYEAVLDISPWKADTSDQWLRDTVYAYPKDQILAAVFASILIGMIIFRYLNLRTGGFIMGAYIALVLVRPLDLLFALVIAAATYFLVTRVLMHHMLLFGRRKLSMMVLTAAILTWGAEIAVIELTGGQFVPWRGFGVITLFVPALLANDAQRQGLPRTLWGAGITATAVFGVMNLIYAARLFITA